MEVDLVISFDANISPLRMIQRMGRTGRKSKGRVDILLFYLLVLLMDFAIIYLFYHVRHRINTHLLGF